MEMKNILMMEIVLFHCLYSKYQITTITYNKLVSYNKLKLEHFQQSLLQPVKADLLSNGLVLPQTIHAGPGSLGWGLNCSPGAQGPCS